jgi:hypothetical protein
MLSRSPTSNITSLGARMNNDHFTHDAYKEAYTKYYEGDNKVDYHLQNGLIYKIYKLCVPKGEILQPIREAHTSKVAGNFGFRKTIASL